MTFARRDGESGAEGLDAHSLPKLYIDLPNHGATGGESIWGRALGDDLYELRNVPFHAYGLNCLDVVRALPLETGGSPWVRELEARSGHRTLRVIFYRECGRERRDRVLRSLRELAVTYEGFDDRYFALDLEPSVDVEAVRAVLDRWMEEGALDYETCEARVPGSFDAGPDG